MIAPGTYAVVGEAHAWKSFALYADGRVNFVDAQDGHVSAWHINTWSEGDRWLTAMKRRLARDELRKEGDEP